jgi:hypothetical protein
MLLFVVAYLGGVLTILSPCILPVLPFVFARGDQPFLKSGLPLLLGMALTFAGVASLAAIALGLDTGVLAQLSLAGTSSVEQALIDKVRPRKPAEPPAEEPVVVTTGPDSTVMMAGSNAMMAPGNAMMAANDSMTMCAGKGAGKCAAAAQWLNSPPLTMEGCAARSC